MAIEPVTREERFLAAAGGQSVTPPTPITRKEQLLQGIIDAVKSGGATPDVIEGAVNDYLNANPVQPGATTEQAAQIEQNKTDIADLQTEVDELKESGGNGSGQNLALDTTLTQSGKAADAKAVGDAMDELKGEIPSIEGLAKTEDIPTKPEDIGALPSTYTPPNQTAEQVGADPKGTAASAVSAHNTNANAHNDIRQELAQINARLTAFFDSDNQTLDELSEIVAYITSNKSLIDAITTSKVGVADIVNNLTTNVSNKPLSAAQGVALKTLIDGLSASLANYQPKGNYASPDDIPAVPTWAMQSSKPSYTASEVGALSKDTKIPAKTSELTNDSGYQTAAQVTVIVQQQLGVIENGTY